MPDGGKIQTWNITQIPVLLSTLSAPGHHDAMVISPDWTLLLAFAPFLTAPYLLFDLPNQNRAGRVSFAAVFSPDCHYIACDGGDFVVIWLTLETAMLSSPPTDDSEKKSRFVIE